MWNGLFGRRDMRILILGLDGAGMQLNNTYVIDREDDDTV